MVLRVLQRYRELGAGFAIALAATAGFVELGSTISTPAEAVQRSSNAQGKRAAASRNRAPPQNQPAQTDHPPVEDQTPEGDRWADPRVQLGRQIPRTRARPRNRLTQRRAPVPFPVCPGAFSGVGCNLPNQDWCGGSAIARADGFGHVDNQPSGSKQLHTFFERTNDLGRREGSRPQQGGNKGCCSEHGQRAGTSLGTTAD
jgi:hypothetical protein